MKKKLMRLSCLFLLPVLLLAACGAPVEPTDPAATESSGTVAPGNLSAEPSDPPAVLPTTAPAEASAANFAVTLLQQSAEAGKNTMISPYSALLALAMAANGADGETLAQMEAVFGLSLEDLNAYLATCQSREGEEVVTANSIWLRDGVQLQPDYQSLMEQYYGAGVFAKRFTADEINAWVNEQTAGRIEKLLEEIDSDVLLYLINALTFDAEWVTQYQPYQVRQQDFHAADGSTQTVSMMHSQESTYLQDGDAKGFLKRYKGGKYSFLALLPGEGVSAEEYLASLTGERLLDCLAQAESTPVVTGLPKFTTETSLTLNRALQAMGMTAAFSDVADFSRLADTSLKISRVIQKTWLQVDESGTKGAAVTAVEMMETTAVGTEQPKQVILDRPFLCAIVDNETNAILFLGIVNTVA